MDAVKRIWQVFHPRKAYRRARWKRDRERFLIRAFGKEGYKKIYGK